jgi:glycosyltransferase involved in cell wall biosynthesis
MLPSNSTLPSATVAVCTRDRPADLQRCLEAILRLPDDGQEILVVDNHPATDATRQIVESCPPARYVWEERPGLDRALSHYFAPVWRTLELDTAIEMIYRKPGRVRWGREVIENQLCSC